MTKLSKKHVDSERFGHYVNNLWSAFTLMDSKEDIRLLFKDLFTNTEYKMFTKRLEIARRLLAGEQYKIIIEELNVTARTITVVSDKLQNQGEGYRKANDKLSKLEEKYLERHREYTKNLENPFRVRSQRKTLLGTALKVGVHALDKAISQKLKQRTAKKHLKE